MLLDLKRFLFPAGNIVAFGKHASNKVQISLHVIYEYLGNIWFSPHTASLEIVRGLFCLEKHPKE